MQKETELMGNTDNRLAILFDPIRFLEKPLESAKLLRNYDRMSLHWLTAQMHSAHLEKEILKASPNSTDWDPIFNSAILDRHKKSGRREMRSTPQRRRFR